jgi:hypothetical protein
MSTETTNIDVTETDDLDSFAAKFFGEDKAEPSDNAKSEEVDDPVVEADDAPTQDEDTQEPSDDGYEDEEDLAPTDTDEETDETPKKANRYQERINEITAARRAAERKAEEAERERDEYKRKLEEKTTKPEEPAPAESAKATELREPQPNDKNEDGSDKYPLGIYDPNYMRDNMQYLFNAQEAERREQEEIARQQREADLTRATLQSSWNEKLVDAQERYPDFRQKGEQMLSVFEGIDESYGQYLQDTIMEMDNGTDVFYYLANNVEEAQKIVSAGPRKATIALGELKAQLSGGSNTNPRPSVKATKAPPPPPQLKGSAVSKGAATPDTDDLDAFSRAFFTK